MALSIPKVCLWDFYMSIEALKSLVSEDFDKVNTLIIDTIHAEAGLIDSLSFHILQSGGKRLRPLLVLLSSHACGYKEGDHHIKLAAMVEFFHTATLLHDDVVDESTLRRGKETANEIWGSKASILVGDYLLTQSVKLMTETENIAVLKLMANTSHKISCGEIKQLMNRHNLSATLEDYFSVIEAKTALLFATSAAIGALITHQDSETVEALYQYGLHLGNAFQLIDDVLDYSTDTKTTGKNTGNDFSQGKLTLPIIHALHHGNEKEREIIEKNLKTGNLLCLPEVLAAIQKTEALEYTRFVAEKEINAASQHLGRLEDSPYKEALKTLLDFALTRAF